MDFFQIRRKNKNEEEEKEKEDEIEEGGERGGSGKRKKNGTLLQ